MLSRVADSIYWINRNIERVENIARYIDVNLHLSLDLPQDATSQWQPLVSVTGDDDWFAEHYDVADDRNVMQFLTFDADYANSILCCLRQARENARMIREIISADMWEQINTLYMYVRDGEQDIERVESPYNFYRRVRMSSCLFFGVMDATMSHGEAWHFARLGQYLERADKTSRILDIKYFMLFPSPDYVGTPFDNIHWSALLKSASGLEAFRKSRRQIDHRSVADFLILDATFPRSIRFAVDRAAQSLHAITGTPPDTFSNEPERQLGRLASELAYTHVDDVVESGLHEFLDVLQRQLNDVGDGIYETFFRVSQS